MYCMPIIIALPCISYGHPKTEVWRQAWWRLSIMKGSVVAIMFHGSKPDLSLFSGHHAGLPWIPGQRCNQIGNSQHDWHILVQMRVNLLNHDKCSSETDSNIINQRACPDVPIFCYWRDCLCPPTSHSKLSYHSVPLFQSHSAHWRASSDSTRPLSNSSGHLSLWHAQVSSTRPFYVWIQTCQSFVSSPAMALTGGVGRNLSHH